MEYSLRTVDKFPRKKVATSIYQSRAFRKRAKIRNPPFLIYPRLPLTDFPTRVSRENFQTNVARQGIVGLDFYRRNARVLNRPRFVLGDYIGIFRDVSFSVLNGRNSGRERYFMEVLVRGNLGVKFWMDGIEYFIGYAIVLSIDIYESLLISRVCVCVLIYSQSSPFSLLLFRNNTEEIFRTSLFSLGNFRLLLPLSKLVVLIGRTTYRGLQWRFY